MTACMPGTSSYVRNLADELFEVVVGPEEELDEVLEVDVVPVIQVVAREAQSVVRVQVVGRLPVQVVKGEGHRDVAAQKCGQSVEKQNVTIRGAARAR